MVFVLAFFVRGFRLIQVACTMVHDGVIVVRKTHQMVVMGEAINGPRVWRKGDRYRWRDEGKHSESGSRNRDSKADASPERCQHARAYKSRTSTILNRQHLVATALQCSPNVRVPLWPNWHALKTARKGSRGRANVRHGRQRHRLQAVVHPIRVMITRMSAYGTKQTFSMRRRMFASRGKTDVDQPLLTNLDL
jgi:hypothetical protein